MREKLIEATKNIRRGKDWEYDISYFVDDLIARGVVIPVRCKGCKHWHEETGWCDQHSHFIDSEGEACHPWESTEWKMFEAEDYCSTGERRIDAQEH